MCIGPANRKFIQVALDGQNKVDACAASVKQTVSREWQSKMRLEMVRASTTASRVPVGGEIGV